ncbi:McrB family protein [Aquiflexum lacus]|uniref:McrB family protein n=1 Tax=Aquiflexum lacus TaxID=2483805 RepID=UPI00189593E4|nr:AAA family ATPase [Aquiflexum lacus]
MSTEKLSEKAKKYSLSDEIIQKRENDRLSFIEKFPLEKIKDLSIDQFVQGTNENSFCYWLEFKKIGFGIGGGNASKFGIYKTKNKEKEVYATGYGKNKTYLNENDAEQYFSELLSKILTALDYTNNDKIDKIKELDIPMWNMVLQKILSIYYPEKFLTIGSSTVLIKCAKELGIIEIELSSENSIQINHECKKAISSNPIYSNWPYEKIGAFIWEAFDGEDEKRKSKKSVKFYLVGAYWDGSNPADQTSRFLENGIWENGYDDKFVDDVKSVPKGSKIAIKAAFTREKTKSVMAIKAMGIVSENHGDGKKLDVQWEKEFSPFEVDFSGGYWATIKEVKNEDHINQIFNRSSKKANPNLFETVKYKFEPGVFENYIHFLRKILRGLEIIPNDNRIVFSVRDNRLNFTVGQRYSFNLYLNDSRGVYGVISKRKLDQNSEPYDGNPPQPFYTYFEEFSPSNSDWSSVIEAIKDELDKTYKSGFRRHNNSDFENYVFDIESEINANDAKMNYPLNSILYGPPGTGKTYNTILRAAEIIENRTIDSYDEAMEIFKTNLHNQIEFITFHQNYSYEDFIQGLRPETDIKSSLVFDKKDGVFKKIADKALENLKLAQKAPDELSNEAKFDKALELFSDKLLESDDNFKINDTAYIFEVEEEAFRYKGEKWTNHANGLRMKFSDLKEFYRNSVKSRKDVKGLSSISGLANQHATYYYLVYAEILKYLPKKTEGPQKVNRKNFVIIIDEINRANISRVFGELITLIEPDKRSHGTVPLEARLPSGDPFIVPSNLYIIGTMNTADKSIALLDIALRRRFEFEPMYPKYSEDGLNVNDENVLKSINQSIISDKGHDFQIGHSYFMDSKEDPYDLKRRMNVKVIPLLLEYFMNDSKAVTQIISKALSDTKFGIVDKSWPLKISEKND